VVLHAEARAAAKLAAFTASTDPWIVAVNMVSEGVDIPRLRVGVYATAAKTPLIFRQIVGRFVRTLPGRPVEPSWLYIPADPVLRDHAATIETELRGSLRRPAEADPFALDERDERRQTERSGTPEFIPLSADVAPQMTLFGAPAAAAAAPSPAAARWATAMAGGEGNGSQSSSVASAPREVPAFERRARLRDERHRLVSEVRRRDGLSHREVNAWVNRKLGIASVEKATLAELERSVELLMTRLTKRR
jgi:superfamily II DNA or RNA helicase